MESILTYQESFKLNGTYQHLVCAVDVNLLGRSVHTIKEKTEDLLVTSKKINLEGNTEKTVCLSLEQNAGECHNINIDNKSFESVGQFIYFGIAVTTQNYIHEEIKSSQNSDNACYYSVQNLFSSRLVFTNTD